MNEKAILGSIAKNFLALFLVLVMLITAFPIVAHIDVDAAEADIADTSANVSSGSGDWVGGLTYTYTVGTSNTNIDGASGSVLVSGSTMTLYAKNAKQTTTGSGCDAKTTKGADTTTTVTVNNNTVNYLKITSLSVAGDAQTGVESGKIIFPNGNFTIKVVSPQIAENDKQEEKSGSVTIEVTPVTIDNTISFLSPQKIDGATPGSYTISDGTSASYTPGTTYPSTLLTEFTLNATTSSGYTFNGWIVNGKRVSTSTEYKTTFVNETNTVRPDYIRSTTTDPLEKIAVLDSDDSSLSKYDVAEYGSYYEPSGYTHVTGTESGNHPSTTATALNYNSYEGIKSGGNGKYIQKDMENVSWTVSNNTDSISASRSGTSYGDNSGYSNKDGSVKTNAKVLRIHALQTINVSFNYNVTEWMEDADSSISNGRQIAFFYSLITKSEAPTLTDLKGGTSWGGTASSFLEDASHSGHFEETISAGQYLYLWFCGYGYSYTSGGNNGAFGYSFSSAVSDVVIRQEARKFDLQPGAVDGAGNMIGSGTVTVNNQDYTVGSSGLTSKLSNLNGSQHMSLAVKTVPTGYTHIGWRIIDNGVPTDVFDSVYEFNIEADSTVYALFSPKITVTAGGTNGFASATYSYTKGSGANQYIARSSDGTTWYKDLNTAFTEQSTVVLATNVDLSGSFTIPSGKTLSVPYGLADVATTNLQRISGSGTISSYITLTVKNSLTVSGNLVASARQEQSTGGYGRIFGKAGYVKVDGSMSLSGTGKLYAYGMITGTGQINVASGGYVYELAEFRDMRQIQAMMDAYNHEKAFPFSQFFIKTNEVSTTYAAGSYLKAMYYINVSGITADGEIPLIGKSTDSEAMFKIASGSLTKAFSSAANNKIIFRAENGSNIQTGNFSINMSATIAGFTQDVNINTANYELPLCYAYAIEVENGGSFTVNSNYKLLPGASLNVKNGGSLTIASGKKIVLYRANDYDFRLYGSSDVQGFCQNGYPTAFTKPSGLTYASNTAANVGSAKLNVDGTLNVTGGLYVTNQLTGNTTYSNGYNYLTGTGTIVINGTLSNGSIYEEKQKGSDTTSSATVAYVPIKGLTNYDATADNGQTYYNSFGKATYYGMINESGVNVWADSRATLSYNANGGSGTAPASVAKPTDKSFTAAANTFTAPANKVFKSWNTKADGTGTSYQPNASVSISADTTLYAQWEYSKYTVSFAMKGHGTAPSNQTVTYGNKVTKPSDPSADGYRFDGWYKEDSLSTLWNFDSDTVKGATTLYAKWSQLYTVAFEEEDGSVDTLSVAADEPVTVPAVPDKEPIPQYSYSAAGWEANGTTVQAGDTITASSDVTYVPVYTSSVNNYKITWQRDDNTSLGEDSVVAYGTKPEPPVAKPTKQANAQYTYEFDHWEWVLKEWNANQIVSSAPASTGASPKSIAPTGAGESESGTGITEVQGEMVYTAVFKSTVNKYTITWVIDGTSTTETYEYGATPSYKGGTPTKTTTAQYSYTFTGWSPTILNVTGDATYTAQFDSTVNKYDITWSINGVSTTETYEYGATPSYKGETPTKAETDQYSYTFTGWSPAISKVTGSATYIAQFSETTKSYTVTWKNENEVIETDQNVFYGTTPTYDGVTPQKAADEDYNYEFVGWSPEISEVHGNQTYSAMFRAIPLKIKHSLTLEGEIGVNFYLPTAKVNDSCTVNLSWGDEGTISHREASFEIKDLTADASENTLTFADDNNGTMYYPLAKARVYGADYYQITVFVAPKQMMDVITLDVVDSGNENVLSDTYKVAEYCYEVIQSGDPDDNNEVYQRMRALRPTLTSEKFADLQELCKAMLAYGAKAQTQFSYHTTNPADAELSKYSYKYECNADTFKDYYTINYAGGTDQMTYYGSSMELEAETAYTVWFRYTDSNYDPPAVVSATLNRAPVTVEKHPVPGNYDAYYVRYDIMNLPANLLTKDVTVSYNGVDGSRTYNAQTYFYLALTNGNATLQDTIRSLYNYSQAAEQYFDK